VLIFKIYNSFYINNLVLKNHEASDATLYHANRVSRRVSNRANGGVRPVLAKKIVLAKKNQTEHPAGHAAAGKWLEPPAKGQERRRNLPQNCKKNSSSHYTFKSQVIDSSAYYGNASSAEREKNFHTLQFSAIYRKTTP